jgi:hypothetical protein
MIAALGIKRCENPDVRCKTYQAVVVARGEGEIRNPLVERGGRVDRKMCRPIELFVGANGAKVAPIGQCTPRGELTGYD